MATAVRFFTAFAAILLLASCQPAPYDIVAIAQGDQIAFETRNTGYFGSNARDPVVATDLAIWSEEGISWRISADHRRPGCGPGTRFAPFPLVYGRLPQCFAEVAPARPLQPGRLYGVASASSSFEGYGAFRAGSPPEHVDWNVAHDRLQPMPDLRDRSTIDHAAAAREANAVTGRNNQ